MHGLLVDAGDPAALLGGEAGEEVRASSGTSSRRSRSGGTQIGKTLRR